MTRVCRALGFVVLLLSAASVRAQTPRPPAQGRLVVTVVDQTGAVLPTATVTVEGLEDATRQKKLDPVNASDQGVASVAGLAPGRYSVQAEFNGFQKNIVKDTRVRVGDNKLTITLALEKMNDSVTVGQDAVLAAADAHGSSFGTTLTREQVDALSDDPAELARQLADMAGAGATLRVDSFEGGQLPPKSQIKSIHVTRDGFAAENHDAGAIFVDIITQPGVGALRGGINTRLRDGAFSGSNPFTGTTPAERTEDFQLNLGGSLIHQRSSFSLNLNGTNQFVKPVQTLSLPGGLQSTVLGQKQTTERLGVNALLDYAVTKDQTLRISYNQFSNTNDNLGIGQYDSPSRAYFTDNQSYQFRVQEAGPLGRRFFTNTRLNISVTNSDSHAATEAQTIQVIEAFTNGGAQQAGGRHGKAFNVQSDLDYVKGIHSVRAGVQFDGGWYRSDNTANYLGTYVFSNDTDFQNGHAISYTQRIGDPAVSYFNMNSGVYLQDDIRVRKNLTLSPGIRYETQTHVHDSNAIGPRFGVTWAPFKSGRTTLRASAGIFYGWLIPDTYERTLLVDGFHQRQVNLSATTVDGVVTQYVPFPDPGSLTALPSDRYQLSAGLHFQHYRRVSAGIDQQVSPKLRFSTTYSYVLGDDLWRGQNLNPLINGGREDPTFVNVIQVMNDANSTQHQLTTSVQANLSGQFAPPNPFGQSGPRFNWRRLTFNGFYTLGSFRNNADNRFWLPPTGDVNLEWGPAPGDVRHRVNIGMSSTQLRNLTVNLNLNASTGTPYSMTTGLDNNSDGQFNDRPAGVGRDTERTAGQWSLNASFVYTFVFGKATVNAPPGIGITQGPGDRAPVVTTFAGTPPRYRLQFIVQTQNITNHTNYGGYSGSVLSSSFGQPTSVVNPRKVDVGFQLSF